MITESDTETRSEDRLLAALAEQVTGPKWLSEMRGIARKRFADLGFPSTRDEDCLKDELDFSEDELDFSEDELAESSETSIYDGWGAVGHVTFLLFTCS